MEYLIDFKKIHIREELDNRLTLLVKTTNQFLSLNKTSSLILTKFAHIDNLNDLVSAFKKEYVNIELDILYKDLEHVLYYMDMLKIISIKNKKVFYDKDTIKIVEDKDLDIVSDFIKDCIQTKNEHSIYKNDNNNLECYSPISIKSRQNKNSEINIMSYKDSKVVGYISMSIENFYDNTRIPLINSIFIDTDINFDLKCSILEDLLKFSQNLLNNSFEYIYYTYNSESKCNLNDILISYGFDEFQKLEKENLTPDSKFSDIYIYRKLVS